MIIPTLFFFPTSFPYLFGSYSVHHAPTDSLWIYGQCYILYYAEGCRYDGKQTIAAIGGASYYYYVHTNAQSALYSSFFGYDVKQLSESKTAFGTNFGSLRISMWKGTCVRLLRIIICLVKHNISIRTFQTVKRIGYGCATALLCA